MGKRKQKHSKKKHKKNINNSKNKSNPNQSNIQSLPSNVLEFIESKTQDPEYILKSIKTDKDTQIVENIKVRLSKYLKLPISTGIGSHIFSHLPSLEADICMRSTDGIAPLVSKLQSQFGIGSLVRFAASPKHFFQRNFQVPPRFFIVLHKDCIFRNVVFMPHNILKLIMNIECKPYDMEREYSYTVIIFDSPQNEVNFVYYEATRFFREKNFKKFLKKDKWNSNTLRNKLPEFVKFFDSQNHERSLPRIHQYLHSGYDSLRLFSTICLPANLAQCIEDKKQKHLIQQILNDMYRKCELNETKYQCLRQSPLMKVIDTKQIVGFVTGQFPFLSDAVKAIMDILGADKLSELYRSKWLEDPRHVTMSKMWKLTKRIEGRNCANCNKKEIRDKNENEKFKKCSRCKSAWYCSAECQKYHWNKIHRLHCSKNRISVLEMSN